LIVALIASVVTGSVAAEGDSKPNEIASGELPPRVDLRPQFVELGLTQRMQGRRGTCSVFATVEGLEFALARSTGRGERLSIEFANWAANSTTGRTDDGDFFHNIIKGIQARGICTDTAMPYEKEFSAERAPSPEAAAEAAKFRDENSVSFHWLRPWNRKPGLEEADLPRIKAVLANGSPVSAGSYHSLLLVGYEDDPKLPGGGRFFVADSEGHERDLDYEAAKKRMCDLFWVTVEPKRAETPSAKASSAG
jgi:hypothetical protein